MKSGLVNSVNRQKNVNNLSKSDTGAGLEKNAPVLNTTLFSFMSG